MKGRPFAAKSVTVAAPPEWYTWPGTLLAAGVGLRERHASGQAAASRTGYPSVAKSESVPAAITLSLRRLWTIYTGTSIGVLMVLAHLIERGEYQNLHEIIKRQGRKDSGAAALNGVGGVAAWRRSCGIVTAVRFVLQSTPREAYGAVCPKKTR